MRQREREREGERIDQRYVPEGRRRRGKAGASADAIISSCVGARFIFLLGREEYVSVWIHGYGYGYH
jgi:hypothetical protein